ncbi:MAG TPA: allantoinase AllB [Rubrobacteraceae bacterium]|nr:allantoinase AllB [Rubrobacteraceae bacterium]
MSNFDVLVRGGSVVTSSGAIEADVGIADGVIVVVEPEVEGGAEVEVDASRMHVLPGLIDAHVHFSEPGRTHWEGFETGTRAFAAGGATTIFDMPLNAFPPTVDAESFDLKREAGERSALVDFALWGAIQPNNLDTMEELAERGAVGFKAFMTPATEDFKNVDDLELYEGMAEAARLGMPVAVHAESPQITGRLTQRALSELRLSARDYTESRPAIAELEAISRAILFAEDTGCTLHIVHVTIGRGVDLVAEARERGVDVSCETCAHYLMLTQDDLEELGAIAKCAPPLRSAQEREALWERILDGRVPMVTSDHSPCPPHMKAGNDFHRAWGGISGGQSTLNVMLTEGEKRGLQLPTLASITAEAVARRFGISSKGRIAVGADADLALVDLNHSGVLEAEDLFYRHKFSPYVGRELKGRVVHTIVRGTRVFSEGKIVAEPKGQLIRPDGVPAKQPVSGSG